MNTEHSQNTFPGAVEAPGTASLNGSTVQIHKVAQTLHGAVDTLETKLGTGTEKVVSLQQEYSDLAREQVRASPLAAIGLAFAVGFVVAKVMTK